MHTVLCKEDEHRRQYLYRWRHRKMATAEHLVNMTGLKHFQAALHCCNRRGMMLLACVPVTSECFVVRSYLSHVHSHKSTAFAAVPHEVKWRICHSFSKRASDEFVAEVIGLKTCTFINPYSNFCSTDITEAHGSQSLMIPHLS
jgi:hypothetical protein